MPVEQVNALREKVGTISSDLKPGAQTEIVETSLRHRLATGQDAGATADVLDNLLDVYGAKGMTLPQASNVVENLRQRGGLSAPEQAELLPSILPTMGHLNMPVEDLQALVGMTTRAGGKNSEIMRGLKTTLLKIPELIEKGELKPTDSMIGIFEQLDQISKESPKKFADMVGTRGMPGVSFIMRNRDLFEQLRTEAAAGAKGDAIGDVLNKLQKDPENKRALDAQKIEAASKNALLKVPEGQQKFLAEMGKKDLGWKTALPLGTKWLGKPLGLAGQISETLGGPKDEVVRAAAEKAISGADDSRTTGLSFRVPKTLQEIRAEEQILAQQATPGESFNLKGPSRAAQSPFKTVFTGTQDPEDAQSFINAYYRARGMGNAPQIEAGEKDQGVAKEDAPGAKLGDSADKMDRAATNLEAATAALAQMLGARPAPPSRAPIGEYF